MSFDRLAPYYSILEWMGFGTGLRRSRVRYLEEVDHCRKALILGPGTGWFLSRLLERNPRVVVDSVDLSGRMLRAASDRLRHKGLCDSGRVHFHHADARAWAYPRRSYDLIVTHFFLDCFEREGVGRLVEAIAASAMKGCLWLVADFQVPTRGLARWRAQLWLRFLYRFFAMTTETEARALVDPSGYLEKSGFQLLSRRTTQWGLLRSDLWKNRS